MFLHQDITVQTRCFWLLDRCDKYAVWFTGRAVYTVTLAMWFQATHYCSRLVRNRTFASAAVRGQIRSRVMWHPCGACEDVHDGASGGTGVFVCVVCLLAILSVRDPSRSLFSISSTQYLRTRVHRYLHASGGVFPISRCCQVLSFLSTVSTLFVVSSYPCGDEKHIGQDVQVESSRD